MGINSRWNASNSELRNFLEKSTRNLILQTHGTAGSALAVPSPGGGHVHAGGDTLNCAEPSPEYHSLQGHQSLSFPAEPPPDVDALMFERLQNAAQSNRGITKKVLRDVLSPYIHEDGSLLMSRSALLTLERPYISAKMDPTLARQIHMLVNAREEREDGSCSVSNLKALKRVGIGDVRDRFLNLHVEEPPANLDQRMFQQLNEAAKTGDGITKDELAAILEPNIHPNRADPQAPLCLGASELPDPQTGAMLLPSAVLRALEDAGKRNWFAEPETRKRIDVLRFTSKKVNDILIVSDPEHLEPLGIGETRTAFLKQLVAEYRTASRTADRTKTDLHQYEYKLYYKERETYVPGKKKQLEARASNARAEKERIGAWLKGVLPQRLLRPRSSSD